MTATVLQGREEQRRLLQNPNEIPSPRSQRPGKHYVILTTPVLPSALQVMLAGEKHAQGCARPVALTTEAAPVRFGAAADRLTPASDQDRKGIAASRLVQTHHFEASLFTCVFNLAPNMAFWFPLPLFRFRIEMFYGLGKGERCL